MKSCCQSGTRRRTGLAAWLVPGGLLVLMPKCPACLAGYVALLTGVGISLPAAAALRNALIACGAAVLMLTLAAIIRRQCLRPVAQGRTGSVDPSAKKRSP